jgi:hypothetical protein
LANDEVKHNLEKSLKVVAARQNKTQGEETKTRIEPETCSQQPPNRSIHFPKSDHLVSPCSRQRRTSRTTMPELAPSPHWCPLRLTPSQRRRIQGMRAQKLREEAAERERDEHFNTI